MSFNYLNLINRAAHKILPIDTQFGQIQDQAYPKFKDFGCFNNDPNGDLKTHEKPLNEVLSADKAYIVANPAHTYSIIRQTHKASYLQNFKRRVDSKKPQINFSELVNPTISKVAYQNGIYQGSMVCKLTTMENMRHGEGITIFNDGTAVVSTWVHNKLDGLSLVFPPNGGLIYCEFVNNMLNGWTIYEYQSKHLVCQLYHLDKLQDGKYSYAASNSIWIHTTKERSESEKCVYGRIPKMIKSESLQKKLSNFFRQNYQLAVKQIKMTKSEELQYFGFVNYSEKPEGLGVIHNNEENYIGNFLDGELHICGRILFRNGDVYSGGFKKGNINGQGTYYNFDRDITIVASMRKNSDKIVAKQKRGFQISPLDFRNSVKIGVVTSQQSLPTLNSIQNIFNIIGVWYVSRREQIVSVKISKASDEISPPEVQKQDQSRSLWQASEKYLTESNDDVLNTVDKRHRKLSVTTPRIDPEDRKFLKPPNIVPQSETIQQYESLAVDGTKENQGKRIPLSSQVNVNLKEREQDGIRGSNLKFDIEKAELTFRKKMTEDIDKRLKDIPETNNVSDLGKKLEALVVNIPRKKRIFDKAIVEKISFQQ